LDSKSEDSDSKEEPVSANSSKDVEASSQDTSIKLIENLHENKALEYISHVKKLLGIGPIFLILWKVKSEIISHFCFHKCLVGIFTASSGFFFVLDSKVVALILPP